MSEGDHPAERELAELRQVVREIVAVGNQPYMLRYETKWAATLAPMLRAAIGDGPPPGNEWCPCCKTFHVNPGIKTDRGVLVKPCPLEEAR